MRTDGRKPKQLRPLRITPSYLKTADGSVLIEVGDTKVICTAKLEERVPQFLRNSGKGWITAEYGMLPGSSQARIGRESARGKIGGCQDGPCAFCTTARGSSLRPWKNACHSASTE